MLSKSLIALALLKGSIASAIHDIPSLPVTFKGNVEYSTPFGMQKAHYFYDYPNSFERFDQDVWGTKTVIINDYTTNVTYTASNAQGPWKCNVGELTNGLWQSTIPANSTYKGNQTVDDVDVELWEYNAVIAKLQYFVQYDGTPKALSTLVRQATISPFLNFQMDFSNVVPTSLDPDTFNVTQFGCPDPKPPKLYSVNGYALDATTGYAIAGASLKFSDVASTTTGSDGRYHIDLPGNYYTIYGAADGFLSTTKDLTVNKDFPAGSGADVYLVPVVRKDQYRVVLSWNAQPRDMDAHLVGPSCEVYYSHRSCSYGTVTATLDHDVVNGYGPETVTMSGIGACTGSDESCKLTFRVVEYSVITNGLNLSGSTVKVYDHSGLINTYVIGEAPTTTCKHWDVFTLSMKDGSIDFVNKFLSC